MIRIPKTRKRYNFEDLKYLFISSNFIGRAAFAWDPRKALRNMHFVHAPRPNAPMLPHAPTFQSPTLWSSVFPGHYCRAVLQGLFAAQRFFLPEIGLSDMVAIPCVSCAPLLGALFYIGRIREMRAVIARPGV